MRLKYPRSLATTICVSALVGAGTLHLYERRGCTDIAFVNRALACEVSGDGSVDYEELEHALRARLDQRLDRTGLHFRDLVNGTSFGINQDAKFAPASLLKLPLAFVMFALEAEHPGTLSTLVPYTPDQARSYTIPSPTEVDASGLALGSPYTLQTLIRASIVSSDNLAYYILLQFLMDRPDGRMRFERTMQEIGIIDPKNFADETVSPRGYAALFRMLYSASYLDVATSEKVLSWLGEARFDKGLATGVRREVVVSNKFGERVLDDGQKQLHDCGVIYSSHHPYSLCVMTRGQDFAELRKTVSEMSEVVYSHVGRASKSD